MAAKKKKKTDKPVRMLGIEYHLIDEAGKSASVGLSAFDSFPEAVKAARQVAHIHKGVRVIGMVECGCMAKLIPMQGWEVVERCPKHDIGQRVIFMPSGRAFREGSLWFDTTAEATQMVNRSAWGSAVKQAQLALDPRNRMLGGLVNQPDEPSKFEFTFRPTKR